MNPKLSFEIWDSGEPKTILLADTSEWGVLINKPAIVEVTPPGFSTPIVKYLQKSKVNVFNSNTLGLSDTQGCFEELPNLPDGVYCITIKGSPDTYNFSRTYLKTDNIQFKLDELFIKQNVTCECSNGINTEDVEKVEFLLKVAHANNKKGLMCKSQEALLMAQDLLEKVNC